MDPCLPTENIYNSHGNNDESISEKGSSDNIQTETKSRMPILSPSRLSSMFDQTLISNWITGAGDQQTTKAQKRTTRVLDDTFKTGLESIRLSKGPDFSLLLEGEDLNDAFEKILVDE